jgi:hypothetical protein
MLLNLDVDQKLRIAEAIVDPDRKIIYFWSPKAGSASIAKAVFDSVGKLEEATAHGWIHKYRQIYAMTHGIQMSDFETHNKEYRKVYFVRNPYSRIASCYSHFVLNPTHHTNVPGADNGWPKKTFFQFLETVEKNQGLWKYGVNSNNINASSLYHSQTQFPSVDCLLKKNIDDIIKVEDILTNKDFFKNLGLDLKPEHFIIGNSHHHLSSYRKGTSSAFYEKMYREPGTREKVEHMYKTDLEFAGYTWEDFASKKKIQIDLKKIKKLFSI